jgi:uncharacterized membrane protein
MTKNHYKLMIALNTIAGLLLAVASVRVYLAAGNHFVAPGVICLLLCVQQFLFVFLTGIPGLKRAKQQELLEKRLHVIQAVQSRLKPVWGPHDTEGERD